MSRFDYLAITGGGVRLSGAVRSSDRASALRMLIGRGYHPLTIAPAKEKSWSLVRLWRRLRERVTTTELAVFTRQLASLLKAGLSMVAALSTLKRQSRKPALVAVIDEITETLSREGSSLAEAMEDHPRIFGGVYRSLVRAGEEGGNLPDVLADMAAYLGQSARLRGQVIGAFIYPLFLLLLGSAAVFILMTFVIPRFQELFRSFGQALPTPTRMLISLSGFLSVWWPAVGAVAAGAVAVAFLALRRGGVRKRLDGVLLSLPVLGGMFLKLEMARIARTLGALLRGGVGILAALRITGATVRNRAVGGTFASILERVAGGTTMGAAMEESRLYPPLMVNLVRTGEETGQLPEMLEELSGIYEDEAQRAVSGAVKLLEPMLIVSMGIVIASIIAAVMLPIFQANAMVE
jgi:general secretion pathway protein F